MELTYKGANCITIATKDVKAIIDPYDDSYGLPKITGFKPDVVAISQPDGTSNSFKDTFNIETPGEYEINKLMIQGISARRHIDSEDEPEKAVMYRFGFDGVRVLVTGNIAPKVSDETLEAIGDIEVLVIPVGGKGLTLDAQAAVSLANQLEPRVIVPVHYDDGKTTYAMPQDGVELFLKELGADNPEKIDKLKVTSRTLPDDTKVVILERS